MAKHQYKFCFGPWNISEGQDPYGPPVRLPQTFDWKLTDALALPDKPETGSPSESMRLVPYGCIKFRISMFPVTSRAWPRETQPQVRPH